MIGDINLYNIYGDCYGSRDSSSSSSSQKKQHSAAVGFDGQLKAPLGATKHFGGPNACIDRCGVSCVVARACYY